MNEEKGVVGRRRRKSKMRGGVKRVCARVVGGGVEQHNGGDSPE